MTPGVNLFDLGAMKGQERRASLRQRRDSAGWARRGSCTPIKLDSTLSNMDEQKMVEEAAVHPGNQGHPVRMVLGEFSDVQ
jgi:hypothetical protein